MRKIFLITLAILILIAARNFFAEENFADAQSVEADKNFAEEVLYYVNVEREKVGLNALKLSPQLMKSAQIRSEEIIKNFSHTRPDGSECFTAVKIRYRYVGENIAAGQPTAKAVVEAWMNSQGHRENILSPNFGRMGIGYVYQPNDAYVHYWAQLFMN